MRSLEAYGEALEMLSEQRGAIQRSDSRLAGINEVSEEAVEAVISALSSAQISRRRTGPSRRRGK